MEDRLVQERIGTALIVLAMVALTLALLPEGLWR